ncbi:MAG: efflux RND transporter periplasmic adaptor subunit, partial [Gemmatimonadota bacterium]|nr:efflux RND transporter periplasmic adaptor subunit [Gemmatimonadota bacterium]
MPVILKRWPVRIGVVAAIALAGLWLYARPSASAESALVTSVRRGDFIVSVTTAGELQAQNSVQISAPANAQQAEMYQMRIASIVPEGTRVNEGDVVAELDRSGLAAKVQEVSLALQKAQAVYEQAQLDTTLTLSAAREEIRSNELALEEKRLAKEQSKYEAPTIQRQAEIDLERADRALAKSKADYRTKTDQARAKMSEVGADLERERGKLAVLQDVMMGFTIRAPKPGMVTYVKEWNGRKRTTGSQVSAWDARVATLPDLTTMESVTYVNEIDVRKIAVGQPAAITLDADPDRRLSGKVTSVANMGEQRPNSDAKVFEVRIAIEGSDTTLRPGMTTGNVTQTYRIENALAVSLEALHNQDSIPFVYKQRGGGVVKQEIETGAVSEDEVVVLRGLDEGDRVLLSTPDDAASLEMVRLPNSKAGQKPAGGDTADAAVIA